MTKKNTATSFFEDVELDEDLTDAIEGYEAAEVEEEIPEEDYVPLIPPPPEPKRTGSPMIIREKRPDTLTVVRRRVPLTKSMCRKPKCNYDAARELGNYPAYKNVPLNRREECLQLLQNHLAIAHSFNDAHIIFSDDLQTEFFGEDSLGRVRTKI